MNDTDEYNFKQREVYCLICHIYSKTIERMPLCYQCGEYLVTVIYSAITGKRITGSYRGENG